MNDSLFLEKHYIRCFLNGDKIETLKIILSPCLVNISDGDMIPIDMFFLKGQDKTFKSYFVPIICKDFWRGQDRTSDNYPPCLVNNSDGDMIPIEMFFEWGRDRDFVNYLVPMPSKYF